MSKIAKPKASVLSHLKPSKGYPPASGGDFPVNPGAINLPFKTKSSAGGNKMGTMPKPSTGKGNKNL